MRINKFISESGFCSRRQADRLIENGSVTINGTRANLGDQVQPGDAVKVDGVPVGSARKKTVYLAFNKPVGIICTSDPNAHDNIIDAVGYPERIFHIGRLDVASSGLILLTNDGNIVNRILRSEHGHEKEYVVRVDKPLTDQALDRLRNGIVILDRKTKPARVKQTAEDVFRITLTEGRNRQIRRMCEALGYHVRGLKRVRIMHIKLGSLKEGTYRLLTDKETTELLERTAETPA